MIQNHFKGKISLQYRSQVTRLHGNRPSLWPAVMERCVGQRVLISWREVKACGEHLRYSMTGDTPALLWDLSQVQVHRTRQHGRQTGGLKSPCTITGLPRLRGYRDMVGSLTTGVLQCMDTGSSGKIACEGRLSVRHYISCQQVLQAPKCHLTLSFLGFLQMCFGPSCDQSYFWGAWYWCK